LITPQWKNLHAQRFNELKGWQSERVQVRTIATVGIGSDRDLRGRGDFGGSREGERNVRRAMRLDLLQAPSHFQ